MSAAFPWAQMLTCLVMFAVAEAFWTVVFRIMAWRDRRRGVVPNAIGAEVHVTVKHGCVDKQWKLPADMSREKARHVVREVAHEILS
jgi:uncharacterized protein (DUF2267 family)